MADKQPDYKKSKNNPYDLNDTTTTQDRTPASRNPSPYDLDEGTSMNPTKRKKGEQES